MADCRERVVSVETDIDWDGDSVVVQDYGLVRVLRHDADGGEVRLRRADGSEFDLSADVFDRRYGGTVREQVLKPLRNNVQAWVAPAAVTVVIDNESTALAAGDAVLRGADEVYEVVPAARYRATYRAVPAEDR